METRWFHALQLPLFIRTVKNNYYVILQSKETCKFPKSYYDGCMAGHALITRPRKTPEQKPAERAETCGPARMLRLIEAAENIFLAKGYHAATMSDVAKAAGMSKKTVYAMIASKADLFVAILEHHHSLLQFPTPELSWTIRDTLIAHLLCLARFLLSPSQIAILRLIMAEYTHSPDFGRVFVRNRVTKAKFKLENCLAEIAAQHPGLIMDDPKELAAMLFGMAIGEFHLGVLIGFRSTPSKLVLEKRVRRAVDIFLAGCLGK